MQISEKSPFDLKALEEFSGDEIEVIALDPMQHAPNGKPSKVKSVPYLIFALCASLYFMPFMRLVRQLRGDEGSFLDGAARIVRAPVFKFNTPRETQNQAAPPTIVGAKN